MYGLAAAAASYLSYYWAFLLVAHAAWAVLKLGRRVLGPPLVGLAAWAVAYLPWLPFLAGSVTSNTVPWRPPPDWSYLALLVMTQVYGGHFLGAAGYYGGAAPGLVQALAGLAPAVAAAGGFALLLRMRADAARFVGWCWTLPLSLVVAVSFLLGKLAAYSYHLTYLQPFAAILTAGLASAPKGERRFPPLPMLALVTVLAYAAAGADGAWRDIRYQPFRYDLAAGYLRSLYRDGDTVVYLPQGLRRVMHQYYVPRGPQFELRFDPSRWSKEDAPGYRNTVKRLLAGAGGRVWVVATPPIPPGAMDAFVRAAEEAGYVRGPLAVFGEVNVAVLVRRAER